MDIVDALIDAEAPQGHSAELRVRAAMQLVAAAALALDWRSPASAQANVLAAGDESALGSGGVNYARYVQPGLAELEDHLADQLGVVGTRSVLACGSGQASLAVLLASLLGADRLARPLVTPTIYFEAHETINLLSGGRAHESGATEPDAIVEAAQRLNADVVFADPLGNGPRPRACDIEALSQAIARRLPSTLLVVDATMVPTAGLYARLASHPHVLLYESSGKYRHLGLDLALGGLLCLPDEWLTRARAARQQTGAVPDRYTVDLWPRCSSVELAARFEQMESAATAIAALLASADLSGWTVSHASLGSHPDNHLVQRLGWYGTCLTLTPPAKVSDAPHRLCEAAIDHARSSGVPLVVGESFGFSVSRLSYTLPGSPLPPLVRLSVGTADSDRIGGIAESLAVGCRAAS